MMTVAVVGMLVALAVFLATMGVASVWDKALEHASAIGTAAIYVMAFSVALLGVALLTGCVQAREAAYYRPPPPRVCKIPVTVNGQFKGCTTAEKLHRDLTGEQR